MAKNDKKVHESGANNVIVKGFFFAENLRLRLNFGKGGEFKVRLMKPQS